MLKYSKEQIITISSALVFLVGAIFMLINVFGGHTWSFAVGLGLAVCASLLAVWAYYINRKAVADSLEKSAQNAQPDLTNEE
ncbi:MAG: hypothetical protein FWE31_03055 [Firmicutes bacterium]|nr:hypothetical protein [Bacillota bacterium]